MLMTLNMTPGETVYGEKKVEIEISETEKKEYRYFATSNLNLMISQYINQADNGIRLEVS